MGGEAHAGGSIGPDDAVLAGDRAPEAGVTSRRATLHGAAAAAALGITSMTLPSASAAASPDNQTPAAVYPVVGTVTGAPGDAETSDSNHTYRTLTFTSGGTFTITSLGDNDLNTFEYLVVGGGGGGGSGWNRNGGGGAGGLVVQGTSVLARAGANYSVTVGLGGSGGTDNAAPANGGPSRLELTEAEGGPTSIASAAGGGRGGSNTSGGELGYVKVDPGPGGGDCNESGTRTARGDFGGGGGTDQGGDVFAAGGGGGAARSDAVPSGDGADATTDSGGDGGAGVASTLTGENYGGGGGGGFQNTGTSDGTRGFGVDGGGNGGLYTSDGTTDLDGKAATANTGGGGGGGTHTNFASNGTSGDGGAGADGIVVVRIRIGPST